MKLRFSIHKEPLTSYFNIDPLPQIKEGDEDQFQVGYFDIRYIDDFIPNSECTEIVCEDILNHTMYLNIYNHLQKLINKLRHNGKITIIDTDAYTVARRYVNGEINTIEYNQLIYGPQNNSCEFKTAQISIEEVSDILKELGVKIIQKSLDTNSYRFIIKGIRP